MRREGLQTLTVEEAVAEMVNMDYIPAGLTLLEMLAAFQEEAEMEYENAQLERRPEEQILPLEIRMHASRERTALAQHLLESLQYEVDHREDPLIVLADESFGKQRLTFESVSDWAADKYGIGISRVTTAVDRADLKGVLWEDVTIKIWKDFKIGYKIKGRHYKRSDFENLDLIDKRSNLPKHHAVILIGLSQGKMYPVGKLQAKHSAVMFRLRGVVQKWIGLPDDPFMGHNPQEGWKPRFKLIDDTHNADDRAKKRAIHVPLDDGLHHDINED